MPLLVKRTVFAFALTLNRENVFLYRSLPLFTVFLHLVAARARTGAEWRVGWQAPPTTFSLEVCGVVSAAWAEKTANVSIPCGPRFRRDRKLDPKCAFLRAVQNIQKMSLVFQTLTLKLTIQQATEFDGHPEGPSP